MKTKYFICVLLFSISEVLIASPPRWFGQEITGYSTLRYFIGEGEGASFSEAVSIAQSMVASQLRVAIESQVNTYVREVSENDRTDIIESFETEIKTTVNETVQGIKVVKKERVKKRYYVTVALNKRMYLAGLQVEMDQLWSKIYKLISDARELVNDGKIFTALENYTDAQPFIPSFYVKKSFYDALSDSPYRVNEFITVEGIISEVRKLIKGIDLEIIKGNNQIGNSGSLLSSAIVVESLFKKRDIVIPNLPLKVKYDDGSIERMSTDSKGQAEIWTTATCGNGERGKIEIGLDLFKLPKLYKKYFINVSTTSKFKCTNDTVVSFSLFIEDEHGERLPKVEEKISKSLVKIGYRVSNKSELSLNGTVAIIEKNEVQGKDGIMIQIKAELSLLLNANSLNETMGSFSSTFFGLGDNEKESMNKAYNKMKIKRKDLSVALSNSEDILDEILGEKSIQNLNKAKSFYNQNKISKAIQALAEVSYGESQIKEARELIKKYKEEKEKYYEDKRKKEAEEREKERNKEIELRKIEAEKEIRIAESNAREKEAEARIAEAKVAMEQAKIEIEKIEKEKFDSNESIVNSDSESKEAKVDPIAAASKKGNSNSTPVTTSLNLNEQSLVKSWEYIGAMEYSTGHYHFEGSGRILSINEDRSFSEGMSSGYWSATEDNFYIDNFSVPYTIEGKTLILGFQISGDLYLMVYEEL